MSGSPSDMSDGGSEADGRLQMCPGDGGSGHRCGVRTEPCGLFFTGGRDHRLERRRRTFRCVGMRARGGHRGVRLGTERQNGPDGRGDDAGRPRQERRPAHRLDETVAATGDVGAAHDLVLPAPRAVIHAGTHPIG